MVRAITGPRSAKRSPTLASASVSHWAGLTMPAAAKKASVLRRSTAAILRVHARWISATTSGVATHRVRRIPW